VTAGDLDVCRLGCGVQLPVVPGFELFFRFCDDGKSHMRMLMPAKLGALAAIDSGAIRADPGCGNMSGNQIGFAVKIRNPKTVNHILGSELELDHPADGNMNFVCRGYHLARHIVFIFYLPPPLLTGYVDRQRLRIGSGQGLERPAGKKGGDQKYEKNENRDDNRAHDQR
jgi:hypothetical protein